MHEPQGADRTLSEWAQARNTGLSVVSKSEPEPVLLTYNLVAVVSDPDVARGLLLKWERVQPAAAGVGFVAMSSEPTRPTRPASEPDGQIARHAGRRIIRGALPGALIGAVIVGTIVAILAPGVGTIVAGALGGAAFGFVGGAMASFIGRTGWSEAYKESFVEPDSTDVVFASIHSDQLDLICEAVRVADAPVDTLLSIDRSGRAAPLDCGDVKLGSH